MADRLIEDQLDGHAGVGTGEDGGERLLAFGGLGMQNLEVMPMGRPSPIDVALVAVHQLLEGLVGRERALSQGVARGD